MPDPAGRPAVQEVRRAVRPALLAPNPDDRPVLVACSGGADSLALLAAALLEADRAGRSVGAVVVDHGLQDGSARVAARAADQARSLGADPVDVVLADVGRAGGPEAAARDARYAALDSVARRYDASAVLLGHTRDDQAETVLLGLSRGSGARSLAGMRAELVRGDVIYRRPLLGLSRATTRAACREFGLVPWDDPHNTELAYTRVRLREQVLPALADALGPGALAALARSADLLRDDADALDAWADRVLDGVDATDLDVDLLAGLPVAVRRRVLRRGALAAGSPAGSLSAAHLDAVDALVDRWRGQGEVALPGPVAAARTCGRLTFRGR